MKKFFGTDGIRGIANSVLTPELAFQVGQAAGSHIIESGLGSKVVLGRDTRRSGAMLGAALASGFCSVGVDTLSLGVVPTGCVSFVARSHGFSLAGVISASHNPAPDNGIKLIGGDGAKLPDDVEAAIESRIGHEAEHRPTGKDVGLLETGRGLVEGYMKWLESLVPERLDGIRVVIDAADGAAYELGPGIFSRLGAEVISFAAEPDGMNINERGGATKPESIQSLTKSHRAALGVAFDGDADRAVFSDADGNLINGDRTMAIWAAHWKPSPAVIVGTVMSNGGFESYLRSVNIELNRADVGDKYVSALLRKLGGKVGGEQSGHIVFPERGPTGDGLVTALELARILKREGKTASDFYGDFENWPQSLVNVQVERKDGWQTNVNLVQAISSAESNLGSRGRINVRASGTQPMLRVMVEADETALRDRESDHVVATMLNELGGHIYSRVDLTNALGD